MNSLLIYCRGILTLVACSFAVAVSGCHESESAPEMIEQVSATSQGSALPESIEIAETFSSWSDFDGLVGIDGLTVYVRPLDADGIPTRAGGSIYVEVWLKGRASGLAEGERVGIWDFPLETEADLEMRWRRSLEMFELPVAISLETISVSPGSAVLVSVTYHSPRGEHLSDRLEMRLPLARASLTGQ